MLTLSHAEVDRQIAANNPGYEHFLCMAKWKSGIYFGNGKCGTSCIVNEKGYDVVPRTVFESMDTTCDAWGL